MAPLMIGMVFGLVQEILFAMDPMNLKSWELNKQITVEKNPFYWDADKSSLMKLDTILFPMNLLKIGCLEQANFMSPMLFL